MTSLRNKVLIIEDDEIYRYELTDFLTQSGYEVYQAVTGQNVNDEIELNTINLLILDLSLPGLNGFEIARKVKSVYTTIGIILLTGRTSRSDRIEGYHSGADIFLAKSTANHEEILAALGSLERRFEIKSTHTTWTLHSDSSELFNTQQDKSLQLTAIEAHLLKLLLTANNRILENDTIISELERYHLKKSLDKRSLENIVSRLKHKIFVTFGYDQKASPIIRSVRGIGYQLTYAIVLIR